MTRRGKIARLPKDIREKLNRRLQNGEPMEPLADWLNGLPEVNTAMQQYFKGEPVNRDNISEWKTGGFADWEREEEAQDEVEQLRESGQRLTESAGGTGVSDHFQAMLAVKMAGVARRLCEEETDPEKLWERLCEVSLQFSRLCRDDHRRVWTLIKRERWDKELASKAKPATLLTPEERARRIREIYGNI